MKGATITDERRKCPENIKQEISTQDILTDVAHVKWETAIRAISHALKKKAAERGVDISILLDGVAIDLN